MYYICVYIFITYIHIYKYNKTPRETEAIYIQFCMPFNLKR